MEEQKGKLLLEKVKVKKLKTTTTKKYHYSTLITLKRDLGEIIKQVALEEAKAKEVILGENPSVEDFFKTFGLSFKKLYQVFVERKKREKT